MRPRTGSRSAGPTVRAVGPTGLVRHAAAKVRRPATTEAVPCGRPNPIVRADLPGRPGHSRPLVREPVAHAIDGQDIAGLARVGLELAADVLDVRVDCPLVRLECDAVDGVEKL
jgi:hypothetical protein